MELVLERRVETITPEDVRIALDLLEMRPATDEEVSGHIERAVVASAPPRFATPEKRLRYLMGQLMRMLIGRVEGRRVWALLCARLGAVQPSPAREGVGA